MKSLDLSRATDSLATYVQNLTEDQLVVFRNGQPVAVLMSVTEDDLEDISLGQNPNFLEILKKSKDNIREKGGFSLEEIQQKLN